MVVLDGEEDRERVWYFDGRFREVFVFVIRCRNILEVIWVIRIISKGWKYECVF